MISELARTIPPAPEKVLQQSPPAFRVARLLLVHAGVRPGVPLAKQQEQDMLWIREEFLASEEHFGKSIVHGHTPVREPDIRPNRV